MGIKIGVIGTGSIGKNHARICDELISLASKRVSSFPGRIHDAEVFFDPFTLKIQTITRHNKW